MYFAATDVLSRSQFSHLQNGNIICSAVETMRAGSLIQHAPLRDVLDKERQQEDSHVQPEGMAQWCWNSRVDACDSFEQTYLHAEDYLLC